MANPTQIPVPEASYAVNSQIGQVSLGLVGAAVVVIPVFLAGPKGSIVDFATVRYDVAVGGACTGILKYVASGTAADTNGTSISTNSLDLDGVANTNQSFTIDPTNNRVPANAQVYIFLSAAATALSGVSIKVGYRNLHN